MRYYNGCPDSELQAILDKNAAAYKKLKLISADAHCTYHHPTGLHKHGWQVHEWGKAISRFHQIKINALFEAIDILAAGDLCGLT